MEDADSGELYGHIDADYLFEMETCIPMPDGKHWIELPIELPDEDLDDNQTVIKVRLWEYTKGDELPPTLVCKHCGTLCTNEAFFHEHEACPECECSLFGGNCRECGMVLTDDEIEAGGICINCAITKEREVKSA